MSDTRPINILSTTTKAITGVDGASYLTQNSGVSGIRIFSNRAFHFKVGSAATTSDTPVAANSAYYMGAKEKGAGIEFALAAGETDGNIWISEFRYS